MPRTRDNAPDQRLIVIGLDGYEDRIAQAMMTEGELSNMKAVFEASGAIDLDHGRNKLSGLSWEHFAVGQAPEVYGRLSAVDFDPSVYIASQTLTRTPPFLKRAGRRVVALDVPYFDLASVPDMPGIANWGAHDPGVTPFARPATLLEEIKDKFGPYKAADDIYGFVWPDAENAKAAGTRLAAALRQRADITQWMLSERVPDWDMAITVVSELHSSIEPLWHGFDKDHPLSNAPSAIPAGEGLREVYLELDRMVGQLQEAFPDAAIALFWMHGMGANNADVASMLLLPELLYRYTVGDINFDTPDRWQNLNGLVPPLEPGERWEQAVMNEMRHCELRKRPLMNRVQRKLSRYLPGAIGKDAYPEVYLGWMPGMHYSFAWPDMEAFALPSFYDGRIRLNVAGREKNGKIAPEDYGAALDRIRDLLLECRDVNTGESVIDEIIFISRGDPMAVPDSTGDIEILWAGEPLGFRHPELGTIGPAPIRRTGGHTGGLGRFYLKADGVPPGHHGKADALDVSPTIDDWLGLAVNPELTGKSFLQLLTSSERAN